MSRIDADNAILVVVDYQERILPAMKDNEKIAEKTAKLIKGCRVLGIPIIATQQYTKGLGETVDVVKKALTEPIGDKVPESQFKHVEKKSFSCMDEPNFKEALLSSGKEQVIVCGIEAHVCVQQTAVDIYDHLLDNIDEDIFDNDDEDSENIVILMKDDEEDDDDIEDFEVFLACDCIGSRDDFDKKMAMDRMSSEGIELGTMESILFEMTRGADNPNFKDISKIVK